MPFTNVKRLFQFCTHLPLIIILYLVLTLFSRLIADQPVIRAFVFGSFARDQQSGSSDLDLLVELDPHIPVGLEYVQMYLDLKDLVGREVDLVTEESLSPFVRSRVEKEKVLIYERAA